MRVVRSVSAVVLFGALFVGSQQSASAQLDGACSATGSWQGTDLIVDAQTIGDDVVIVPRSDTVDWTGSVSGAPGEYEGSVIVVLPPPFGSIEIDSWSGDSQTTANSGMEEYDLPSLVPAGVEFRVEGTHTDANGTCSGYVLLEVDGGPFDSPLTYVSLFGTIVSGGGAFMLLRPMFRKVV